MVQLGNLVPTIFTSVLNILFLENLTINIMMYDGSGLLGHDAVLLGQCWAALTHTTVKTKKESQIFSNHTFHVHMYSIVVNRMDRLQSCICSSYSVRYLNIKTVNVIQPSLQQSESDTFIPMVLPFVLVNLVHLFGCFLIPVTLCIIQQYCQKSLSFYDAFHLLPVAVLGIWQNDILVKEFPFGES